jgi:para-nitrobenzyl esterase
VLLLVSLLAAASLAVAVPSGSSTVVATKAGKVEGFVGPDGTLVWKGIPFARPPVGKLRWKEPRRPRRWKGIRETATYADMCPQYLEGTIVGSEDCLYLNVWRPDTSETDLPIYFWIHGGGNSTGSTVDWYDGAKLAREGNLVVVTIQYRLGPLGWFTHPALRKGKRGTAPRKGKWGAAFSDSGNYGTLDIIMALKWVRKNIEGFGGDPDNVTIAGESAGGFNVNSLVISPAAAGLFHKAISQSAGTPGRLSSLATGDAHANDVIEKLLINDGIATPEDAQAYREGMKGRKIARYLRSKTGEELLAVHEPFSGDMITIPNCFTDGVVIHEDGFDALLDPGEYNQVPMIAGTNQEEYKLFLMPYYDLWPACEYQAEADFNSVQWRIEAVDTLATILASQPSQPGVYAYQYLYGMYRHAGPDCEPDPAAYNAWLDLRPMGPNLGLMLGASHGLEINFFFGNYWFGEAGPFLFRADNRPGYEALTEAMMAYVAEFAYTGSPGDAGGVMWNPWTNTPGEMKRILFDANATEALIEMWPD